VCERYILASRNLPPWEIFDILSRLTGVTGPRLKPPQQALLPLEYLNQWLAEYVTNRPARILLHGVRMATHCMYYNSSEAVREWGYLRRLSRSRSRKR
jgi:hypothetical protein